MCVCLALQMEPVRIDYDAYQLGHQYRPSLVEWGTEDALELTCPDFSPRLGQEDPGPLPTHMAPLGAPPAGPGWPRSSAVALRLV